MIPLIGLIQLLFVGFVVYELYLIAYTSWALTHPPRQTYSSAISRSYPGDPSELDDPIEYREDEFKDRDGRSIRYWVLEGRDRDGPNVIMTHGWGSSRIGGLKRLEPIIKRAHRVIVWDLPGHGESDGNARMGVDEHHVLDQLISSIDGFEDHPIVCYGWSMGAGITLAFAHEYGDRHSMVGLVCESPYIRAITPARNVIRLRGVPYRLNLRPAMMILGARLGIGPKWNGFARDQIAREIEFPIRVLHGSHDPVCPIDDGERIGSCAQNGSCTVIDQGGHNNLWNEPTLRTIMCHEMDSILSSFKSSK